MSGRWCRMTPLVAVLLTTGRADLADQPSAKTDAIDIAHAIMDKVSALS